MDNFLLDEKMGITTVGGSQQFLIVISKQDLENIVMKNFTTLAMLEESFISFCSEQQVPIQDTMLSQFDEIFKEVKSMQEQLQTAMETRLKISVAAKEPSALGYYSELYSKFHESLKKSIELAAVTTFALGYSQNDDHLSDDFLSSIPSWTALFNSYASKLQLERLSDNVLKTIVYAVSSFSVFFYITFCFVIC